MTEKSNHLNIEQLSPLNDLSGVRLRIFCYLLQQKEPVGVRQTQRSLGLKTASHANYHLQKLVELKIAEQTAQNTYYLLPEYKIKSIKVNVLAEYMLIAGKFWPRSVFFAAYLVFSMSIAIILIFKDDFNILKGYVIISIAISLGITAFEVKREIAALPWEEEDPLA